MRIVMFGAYDPEYARNRVLRLGLGRLGVDVQECRAPPRARFVRRSATLGWRVRRVLPATAFLVPEFRHKDVPLARLIATLNGTALVVDPLVSRYDTKVGDWGTTAAHALQAGHNQRIDRAALAFADLVLCDTQAHAEYYQTAYRVRPDRCAVVPVGFDDTVFAPIPEPPPGPFRVAFFGSYLPLHGIDTIVAAAIRLAAEGVQFLLVGQGQTFGHVEAARAAGLTVEVSAPLAPPALVERLRTAHVLLGVFGTSAKVARVVPNKVYQGLALGRAMVTADTPALREFFTPGEHLLAVRPGDPEALVDAIRRLRDDTALRLRLGATAARYVHASFNPRTVARRLIAAGHHVLGWEDIGG